MRAFVVRVYPPRRFPPLATGRCSKSAGFEHCLENVHFRGVDFDVMDNLIPKEDAIASFLSEEQLAGVRDLFGKALTKPCMEVAVESLSADELPVTVTMEEWMRSMKEMAALNGGRGMNFYGAMPDRFKVAVNANPPLITRILATKEPEEQTKPAKQAYDLTLLSQGMLIAAELTNFVNKSIEMIGA